MAQMARSWSRLLMKGQNLSGLDTSPVECQAMGPSTVSTNGLLKQNLLVLGCCFFKKPSQNRAAFIFDFD